MRNIRRELYKELKVKYKDKKSTYNEVCKILTQNEIDVFNNHILFTLFKKSLYRDFCKISNFLNGLRVRKPIVVKNTKIES